MILQFVINGLITGLLYSVASLGFALVYNTTKIFHIAMAVIYVAASYIFWQLGVKMQMPFMISIIAAVLFTGLLSLIIEKLVYLPLMKVNASLNVVLVSSIGVFTILTNVIALIWGNETKVFQSEISDIYTLGEIIVTEKQLLQFVVSAIVIFIFFFLINRSRIGLQIKAVRDDPELFQVMGFRIAHIRAKVFMLSGIIIAIGSCMTAWDIGMDPYVGMPVLLNAIVAMVIGGLGRFRSALIGGIFLGLIQALVVWKWSAQWQEAFTFLILIVFLFLRPQGFVGEKRRIV